MPLIKRLVEPTELSRGKLEDGLKNELEAVSVKTLSGIMRQLSSLSKHAEDMFGELCNEATSIYQRTNSLHERIQSLSIKVTKLDSNVEELALHDINMRKAFKSTIITDQQVLASNTLPLAMKERYQQCDRPPLLQEMNKYRDDKKDALKFYTDPTYFFELWCEDMRKETDKRKKKKHGVRKRAGTRNKAPVKAVKKKTYCAQGAEFQTHQSTSPAPGTSNGPPLQNGEVKDAKVTNHIMNHPEPSPDKSGSPVVKRYSRRYTGHNNIQKPMSAPPPPPPLPPTKGVQDSLSGSEEFFPPPPAEAHAHPTLPQGMSAPPPPPPPPPLPGQVQRPGGNIPATDISVRGQQQESQSVKSLTASESSASVHSETPLPPDDGRSDLLAAIRRGMELRKVQVQEAKKERRDDGNDTMDVASILARRIAVEYSSSEDESETGSEWDDDED